MLDCRLNERILAMPLILTVGGKKNHRLGARYSRWTVYAQLLFRSDVFPSCTGSAQPFTINRPFDRIGGVKVRSWRRRSIGDTEGLLPDTAFRCRTKTQLLVTSSKTAAACACAEQRAAPLVSKKNKKTKGHGPYFLCVTFNKKKETSAHHGCVISVTRSEQHLKHRRNIYILTT